MTLLREIFLTVDSEDHSFYLSHGNGADLPDNPEFYEMADVQRTLYSSQIPQENLQSVSVSEEGIFVAVSSDEVDFPIRLEIWDAPPDDIHPQQLNAWCYIAEVSFDLPEGRLYIHSLMDWDVATPIAVSPGSYSIRIYLGQLDHLDATYVEEHWTLADDEEDECVLDEADGYNPIPRLQDPERNSWCRLVLWLSPHANPQEILPKY